MSNINLAELSWTLVGWRPFTWKLGKSMDAGWRMPADLGPYPISIPGTVQRALLEAGVIEDWNVGFNSRACEWVEHRHWDLTTTIPGGVLTPGAPVVLDAEGLDYSGWILVDCVEVARFEGALIPHRFDLTAALGDGKPHQLSIIFEEPPREQGQIGFTSLSHFFKPRYSYSWDWCPRIVPIGVSGALTLRTDDAARIDCVRVRTRLGRNNRTGSVDVELLCGPAQDPASRIVVSLCDGDREIVRKEVPASSGRCRLELRRLRVEPWWPNGVGAQKLYRLEVEVLDAQARPSWSKSLPVGFKRVEWLPCEGAPAGAEPWVCAVNGKPVFLQGVNWVPPEASYPDAKEDDYRTLIGLYKEMGCNVFRVWGGAILETETFYTLCDQAGILVWQEFPLSSSGVENWPPDDRTAIRQIAQIAESYIRRRGHHVSLLMWCGGNELMGGEGGEKTGTRPVDCSHPCIAALRKVVRKHDPDRRFIPTSASGPRECAAAEEFGNGLHHDVHGPWGMGGFADIEAWRAYWEQDDALFRSEVGMPGAASVEHVRRYAGAARFWLPNTEYWRHTAAWWTLWDRYEKLLGDMPEEEALGEYVRLTQEHQARAYGIAARSCKERLPRCGGFIIWMGHDLYPCPSNNAVIDFDRRPKPAYFALQRVFRS